MICRNETEEKLTNANLENLTKPDIENLTKPYIEQELESVSAQLRAVLPDHGRSGRLRR